MRTTERSETGLRRRALAVFAATTLFVLAEVLLTRGLAGDPRAEQDVTLHLDDLVGTVSTAVVGLLLSWARPHNPVGWLIGLSSFVLALCDLGQIYGVRALVVPEDQLPLGTLALSLSAPLWVAAVFIPASLLLVRYPDGHIESRWARRFDRAVILGFAVVWVGYATSAQSVTDEVPNRLPPILFPEVVSGTFLAVGVALVLVGTLAIIGDAVRRAVRGTRPERLALLWLMTASVIAVLTIWFGPWEWLGSIAYAGVLVAIAVGVLRYQAMGIDIVVRRTLVYAVLTGLVLAVFVGVVSAIAQVVPSGSAPEVVAAVLIAVGLGPARERVQALVDRLVYGDRADPFQAMRRMSTPLNSTGNDLVPAVLAALAGALRVPEVTIEPPGTDGVPLVFGGEELGRLRIPPRRGESAVARADARLLEGVAPLVAAIVHGVRATQDERRRLRQELHDGLGPSLTGIGLGLEAAQRSGATDELLGRLREEVTASLEEVRRIIDDLRPTALEHGDLLVALRRRTEQMSSTAGVHVDFDAPSVIPELSPHVAAAAFRIADEALTNVVRHASAQHCRVQLRFDDDLHLEVSDDGVGPGAGRDGGVGLVSMRERAERLGGRFTLRATHPGTAVLAELPLATP